MLTLLRTALYVLALAAAAGCDSTADTATASPGTVGRSADPSPVASAAPPAATPGPWREVGKSVQGRPVRARTIGTGPRRVLFIGGIHGDEPEGAYTTAQLPTAFIDAGLAATVTLNILEDANPDGTAIRTRGNANGVDVNRNFPASNFDRTNPTNGGSPLSQPESLAVHRTIQRIRPDLVLVLHSWNGDQFVNFDGPARSVAERFSATSGLPVQESTGFAPTPGSLGSFVGRDGGIPILTIEVLRGTDAEQVWAKIRTALLEAVAGRTSTGIP